ncbi:outer membrane protein assembly factor BamB family protein [Nocardiopsis potens]|uniref:outer membrane protein assembly factor BamB family protein n=1 Tax=Nocardiopsis potens TaxID=1246458 RepID=UPI00034837B6|nr:PQQ-binding-like beta-propeller repeat protein [Nocardiopsis potens]
MAGSAKRAGEVLRRHPRRSAAAAAVVALALAAGLGAVLLRPGGAGGPALSVSPQAYLDTAGDLGMDEVLAVGFRGDSAVVMGTFLHGRLRLAVVDAESGEPRWVRDTGTLIDAGAVLGGAESVEPLAFGEVSAPVLTGEGDDWSVVVPYAVTGRKGDVDDTALLDAEERGVAALSGSDGAVRWKRETPGVPRVLDGAGGTVLVGAKASADPAEAGEVTSMALDAEDGGAVLWEHEGDWVHRLAGDTALGESAPGDWEPGADATTEGHRVFALDARTGRAKWDLDGVFSESGVEDATEGWAVLYGVPREDGAPARTAVVRTGSGEEARSPRGHLGTGLPTCAAGEDARLVCVQDAYGSFELIALAPGGSGAERSTEAAGLEPGDADGLRVHAVSGGRIHLTAPPPDGEEERRSFVIDRSGAVLAEDLPGEVVAAAPDRIAVAPDPSDGTGRIAFHRTAEGDAPPPPGPSPAPAAEPMPFEPAPRLGLSTFGAAAPDGTDVDAGLHRIHGAVLAGGSLVYAGEDDDGILVSALDPDTGEERWTLGGGDGPGAIGALGADSRRLAVAGGDGGVLLVPHGLDGGRSGVSAVSAGDGEVLWTEPLGGGADFLDRLFGSEEDLFAVGRTDYGDSSVTAARTEVREVGSGRLVHTEEDAEAAGIGGGALVVERRTPPYGSGPDRGPAEEVAGVDPRTGEERWSLDGRYERPRVVEVAGDRAVVVEHGGGTAVLDPATGEEIASSATRADRCSGTAEPLLVCRAGAAGSGGDGTLPVVVEAGGAEASIRPLPGLPGPKDLAGAERWMFARDADAPLGEAPGMPGEGPYRMFDAHGRPLLDGLPGRAISADDEHVVLLDGELGELSTAGARITVHRRG